MRKSFKTAINVEDSRLLYKKALMLVTSKSDSPEAVKESLEIFRSLANQGYAPAQCTLGVWYDEGIGITRDYGEALKWYTLAANQKFAPAQYAIGILYENGHGVLRDYGEALKWYTLSANQGYVTAQEDLDDMYEMTIV